MNATFRISFLLSFILLLSNCNSFAQKKDKLTTEIDSLIKVSNPKFNGTILITENGKTVYSKVAGLANFKTKKPLTINTQFEIMSNSKQVAAVLILLEVEKGNINLQDPIKKYLPELTQSWADSITVHQLLNHTHGIVDLQKPLAFKPGSDFKYGNISFNLLGKIVEFSSKKSYTEMANALFKKLKMKNTFVYAESKAQNLATGYINKNGIFDPVKGSQINSESLGADGIISTVNDLAIWNNNLHKGKILKPESYKLMTNYNALNQHNVFGKEKTGYGYGIKIVDKEPVKYIGHTGLGDGFSSVNLYFPEKDINLIVLENQMNDNPDFFYLSEIKMKNILLKSNLFHQN